MEKLEFIINTYGEASQVDKCIEECSELQKALLKHRRNPTVSTRDEVIDEIADVGIMLEQMKMIYFCENEVKIRTQYKVERQIERIKYGEEKI